MRIGVAGVGRIGAMHAANLATLDGVDEVVLADGAPGRAEQVAATLAAGRPAGGQGGHTRAGDAGGDRSGERSGGGLGAGASGSGPTAVISAVAGLDELFARVDGVVIATPTNTHPALVRQAIKAGVPALCEKPIAGERREMSQLVDEVEASGVPVVVGFQRRFDPAIVELKRRLVAGELGDVYLVNARGHDAEPPNFGYLPTSGGIYRDLLIHDLDAVPWLVGEPVVRVYAAGSVLVDRAFADADDVDTTAVTLTFASGALAVLTGGRHDPRGYDHRIEVLGSKDSLAVGLDARTPLSSLEPDGPQASEDAYPGFPERFARAYRNEMAVFTDVVAGRAANPSPVRDSLVSLELALAAERSRREGHPVTLSPIAGGVR